MEIAYITAKKTVNPLTFTRRCDNQIGWEPEMNKKDIAVQMFKKLDIKRFEAYSFIDLLIEAIGEQLAKGEKVVISNFGTFKVVERLEKKVVNPNTKKEMKIAARRIVKFLPSRNLKELVRKK
jgi:nucleoid DNA-binding protein